MQEYSQLHSLPSPRLLVTIPSHVLNFPPSTLHARVFSTSQSPLSKTSCHDSKLIFKLPPQTLHARVFSTSQSPLSKTSYHDSKSFFKLPLPKPLHARVFSASQSPLPKTSYHDSKSFFKFPLLNLYMQEYSQLHSLPSPRLLVTIPSHFLNFPP